MSFVGEGLTEVAADDMISGAPLTPCAGAKTHEAEAEAAAVAAAVSSLSLSSDSEGGKAAASAADAPAGAGAGDASGSSEKKWVEMPMAHVRWILAQKPEMHPPPSIEEYDEFYRTHDVPVEPTGVFSQANRDAKRELYAELFVSLRESHDDFIRYQARIREVFDRNGRVMVPEEVLGPRDDLQAELDDIWEKAREEYLKEHPELELDSDSDQEEEDQEEHA